MRSNRYTMPIWTNFSVFHDSSEHTVDVYVDGKNIYNKFFSPGIKHSVKIDEVFDFRSSDHKEIMIHWQGNHETQNKYLIIDKWVINNQQLSAYKCMYLPDENEYIRNIKQNGTPEEKQILRRQILFSGNRFGWFGKIIWNFVLGNTLEVKKTLLANTPKQLIGEKHHPIFTDEEEAKLFDRVKKKY